MNIKLPELPEAIELELELTNICNAQCVTCPRNKITVPIGYMAKETFKTIIAKYEKQRKYFAINKIIGNLSYPFITFAGMGEPLIHPHVYEYITYASQRGFSTILITNASTLNKKNAHKLIESGISRIYISFWGIQKKEYERSMGLNFKHTLKNVEYVAQLASQHGIPLMVTWIRTPFISSSPMSIKEFWNSRNIEVDNNDNNPWNRGGHLEDKTLFDIKKLKAVDFNKEIWCSQLYFTNTICWNGDFIICCNDYYTKSVILGNIHIDDINNIAIKIQSILKKKIKLPICIQCRKPTHNYSFASYPWDNVLDEEQKKLYDYDLYSHANCGGNS